MDKGDGGWGASWDGGVVLQGGNGGTWEGDGGLGGVWPNFDRGVKVDPGVDWIVLDGLGIRIGPRVCFIFGFGILGIRLVYLVLKRTNFVI